MRSTSSVFATITSLKGSSTPESHQALVQVYQEFYFLCVPYIFRVNKLDALGFPHYYHNSMGDFYDILLQVKGTFYNSL